MLGNFIRKSKLMDKLVISIIIFALTAANFIILGSYIVSYAVEENLEEQTTSFENGAIEFNAYFKNQNEELTHSSICDVNKENVYTIDLKINSGYLKNAKIELQNNNGEKETNYTVKKISENSKVVNFFNNEIQLNQINSNESINIPVNFENTGVKELKLNDISKIVLKGTFVNNKAQEKEITEEIKLNIGWEGKHVLNLEQEVAKYIPYKYGENTGLILTMLVKAELQNANEGETNKLPIKKIVLEAEAPKINNELPETVNVIGNQTPGTTTAWEYKDGKVVVTYTNDSENVYINEKTAESFYITYIYSAEEFTYAKKEEKINIASRIKANVDVYKNTDIEVLEKEIAGTCELGEIVGETVDFEFNYSLMPDIAKKLMYANLLNKQEELYKYSTITKIRMVDPSIIKTVRITDISDVFIGTEEYELGENNYLKQTKVNKQYFDKILGENGSISVIDADGEVLYEMNKDTEKDEDGNYVLNYAEKISGVTFEISTPVKYGILSIENVKGIDGDIEFNKEEIKDFKKIKSSINSGVKHIEEEIFTEDGKNTEEEIENTVTKMIAEISKSELYALTNNKEIDFKFIFNDDELNADIYKNPYIQVELPKEIKDIEINGYEIFYNDEIKIKKVEKAKAEDKVILKIELEGEQTKVVNKVKGTTIMVNANLDLNEVEKDKEISANVFYSNEVAEEYETATEDGKYGYTKIDITAKYVKPEETPEETPKDPGDGVENPKDPIENQENNSINDPENSDEVEIQEPLLVTMSSENYTYYKVEEGEELLYQIRVNNNTSEDIKDVKVESYIPEGTEYKSAELLYFNSETKQYEGKSENIEYNEINKLIVANIDVIAGKDSQIIEIKVIVKELEKNQNSKTLKNKAFVTSNNKTYISNEIEYNVVKPVLKVSQTVSNANTYIKEYDVVEYIITVENIGTATAREVNITDIIPDGMKCINYEYAIAGNSKQSGFPVNNSVNIKTNLSEKEKIVLQIKAKANVLPMNVKEFEIINYATISGKNMPTVKTNEAKYIVGINDQYQKTESTITEPTVLKYKVSGIAWLDTNENGAIDEKETKLENIKALLIDLSTGTIVSETTTNTKGEYTFNNVVKGNYYVVFEYNSSKYGLTEYKKDSITENVNSDAIETKIEKDGVIILGAITDTIIITNNSISGINIGLVENPKFDLKLEKYINKIVVQNSEGTKTYMYENDTLAKIEIDKKNVEGTVVTIEYKIAIINEGEIAGYAKKIVEYLPTGVTYVDNENTKWEKATDGTYYTNALADSEIKPGEGRELTIKVAKKLTSSNLGILNNTAEIAEYYNKSGAEDIDSIPANNKQGEDDLASVNVIISLKTGEIVTYVILAITTIALLTIGIILIKKYVLK